MNSDENMVAGGENLEPDDQAVKPHAPSIYTAKTKLYDKIPISAGGLTIVIWVLVAALLVCVALALLETV